MGTICHTAIVLVAVAGASSVWSATGIGDDAMPDVLTLTMSDHDRVRPTVEIAATGEIGKKAKPVAMVLGQRARLRFPSHRTKDGVDYPEYSLAEVRGDALVQLGEPSAPSVPEGGRGLRYRTVTFEARKKGRSTIVVEYSTPRTETYSIEVVTPEELAARIERDGPDVLRFRGISCGIRTASQQVIEDEATWKKVWGQVNNGNMWDLFGGQPKLPEIDFDKQMVLAVFMGQRGNVNSIEIVAIKDTGKRVEVHVHSSDPPKVRRAKPVPFHLVGLPMVTEPYDIVVIPKPNKPVKFVMK